MFLSFLQINFISDMADLQRLPNLAALRAFEAAARHENFSLAAKELHLTSSAISHQVRGLEEEIGVALFMRHGKRIAITPDGRRFAATLRKLMSEIADATEALKHGGRQQRLTISTTPSFAARWLSQRLGRFIERHPGMEVMLQSSAALTDFTLESTDVGIRVGNGPYPGLAVERLMDDYYYPVVSPRFNGGRLPRSPRELSKSTLLRCQLEPWLPWFQSARLDLGEPTSRLVFQDSSMLVRAAIEGHGIALGRHVLVAPELASGELVRLFDVALKCPFSYYLVCLPESLHKPQVQAFREWVIDEVGRLSMPAP
jgi:LysR family glycine cleavage system transcriptional activator